MSIHLVNKVSALPACLSVADKHDAIVLYEDGAYASLQSSRDFSIYVIADDVVARGLSNLVAVNNKIIDHTQWVELMMIHSPSVTWG